MTWKAMLMAAVVATTALTAPPDLGGDWRLDEELSDDVMAYFQQAINNQPRQRLPARDNMGDTAGVGGLGGSAGGYPVGRTARVSVRDPDTLLSRMQELADGFETLSIHLESPMMSMILADGRRRSFRTDGKRSKKNSISGVGGDSSWNRKAGSKKHTAVTSAKFKKDGRLVVITSTEFGREVTETFRLLPETGQLTLTTELHPTAGMPPVTVRRVYDRADTSSED